MRINNRNEYLNLTKLSKIAIMPHQNMCQIIC